MLSLHLSSNLGRNGKGEGNSSPKGSFACSIFLHINLPSYKLTLLVFLTV